MSYGRRLLTVAVLGVASLGPAQGETLDAASRADLLRSLGPRVEFGKPQAAVRLYDLGDEGVKMLLAALTDEDKTMADGARGGLHSLAMQYAKAESDRARRTSFSTLLSRYLLGDAPNGPKLAVIESLRKAGGREAVPGLAACLRHQDLAESASQALAAISGVEAPAALREALPNIQGEARVHVIEALAKRRDRAAVPVLAAQLRAGDEVARRAAMRALQDLGDPQAAPALAAVLGRGSEAESDTAFKAYLSLGGGLERAQKASEALLIYRTALNAASTDHQKRAALGAFGKLGSAQDVPALAGFLADTSDVVREAARNCLLGLRDPGTGEALAEAMKAASGAQKAALLRIVSTRKDPQAAGLLATATADPDGEVRLTALQLLGRVTDPSSEDTLAAAAAIGSQTAKALSAEAYLEVGDARWRAARGAPLAAYARALEAAVTEDERDRALKALASTCGAVPSPGKSGNVRPDREADAAAAEIASEPAEALGVDSYLQAGDARRNAAHDDAEAAYTRAGELATTREQRNRALHALGVATRKYPFRGWGGRLSPEDRRQGFVAYLGVAFRVADAGRKDRAIGMLRRVVDGAPDDQVVATALGRLRELGVDLDPARVGGFVTTWWVLGPFAGHVISVFRRPESRVDLAATVVAGDRRLTWVKHHTTHPRGVVDLNALMKPDQNMAAYLYAEVTVDRNQPVLLKTGSDDKEIIWLNGQEIYRYDGMRSLRVDEDTIRTVLSAGTNRLLLRVGNVTLGWLVCLRLSDLDGKPLDFVQREN